jgi:hypothetical protein
MPRALRAFQEWRGRRACRSRPRRWAWPRAPNRRRWTGCRRCAGPERVRQALHEALGLLGGPDPVSSREGRVARRDGTGQPADRHLPWAP